MTTEQPNQQQERIKASVIHAIARLFQTDPEMQFGGKLSMEFILCITLDTNNICFLLEIQKPRNTDHNNNIKCDKNDCDSNATQSKSGDVCSAVIKNISSGTFHECKLIADSGSSNRDDSTFSLLDHTVPGLVSSRVDSESLHLPAITSDVLLGTTAGEPPSSTQLTATSKGSGQKECRDHVSNVCNIDMKRKYAHDAAQSTNCDQLPCVRIKEEKIDPYFDAMEKKLQTAVPLTGNNGEYHPMETEESDLSWTDLGQIPKPRDVSECSNEGKLIIHVTFPTLAAAPSPKALTKHNNSVKMCVEERTADSGPAESSNATSTNSKPILADNAGLDLRHRRPISETQETSESDEKGLVFNGVCQNVEIRAVTTTPESRDEGEISTSGDETVDMSAGYDNKGDGNMIDKYIITETFGTESPGMTEETGLSALTKRKMIGTPEGKHDYGCDVCKMTFDRSVGLHKHQSSQLSCSVCKKIFCQSVYLKKHIQSRHVGQVEVVSEVRVAAMGTASRSYCHSRHSHRRDGNMLTRPYRCQHCDKSYRHSHQLKRHVTHTHMGVKGKNRQRRHYRSGGRYHEKGSTPYACEVRDKMSKTREDRRYLARNHGVPSNNKCRYCHARFDNHEELDKHVNKAHSQETQHSRTRKKSNNLRDRIYLTKRCGKIYCSKCKALSKNVFDLQHHLAAFHCTSKGPVQCWCGTDFPSLSYLQDHIDLVHI